MVSAWILSMGGTNKRSGGWEEVPASPQWVVSVLYWRLQFLLGGPLHGALSKFCYYSCPFTFSNLRVLPGLIILGYCIIAIYPPKPCPDLWKWAFIKLTSNCLNLVCHLFPDGYFFFFLQWQLLVLLDKSQNHPEEEKENVTREGQNFALQKWKSNGINWWDFEWEVWDGLMIHCPEICVQRCL